MLHLKQNLSRTAFRRCFLSGQFILFNDWYYEDDETNKVYLYEAYWERRKYEEEQRFDYSKLLLAQRQEEYKEELKKYEREYLEQTILDKPVFGSKDYLGRKE